MVEDIYRSKMNVGCGGKRHTRCCNEGVNTTANLKKEAWKKFLTPSREEDRLESNIKRKELKSK
jgi:hypothetical protein